MKVSTSYTTLLPRCLIKKRKEMPIQAPFEVVEPLHGILYLTVMVSQRTDPDFSPTNLRVESNPVDSPPNVVESLTYPMQEEDITARYYTNTYDARASGAFNVVLGNQNIYNTGSSRMA